MIRPVTAADDAARGSLDDDGVRLVLRAALVEMTTEDPGDGAGPGDRAMVDVEVTRPTAGRQWEFDGCLDASLALRARGAVMVRGRPGPLTPSVRSGGFG